MIEKKCLICNKIFNARNNNEKYCKYKHIVQCQICGKDVDLNTNLKKSKYYTQGFITCSQKCAKIKMMITNKDRYGYSTPLFNPQIKAKVSKIQQTNDYKNKISESVKKYKAKMSEEEKLRIINKIKDTNKKRYNISCTLQLPSSRKTMLERYGVEYTGQSKKLLNKMQSTNMIKYGYKMPFGNINCLDEDIHKIIDNKSEFEKYILSIKYQDRTQSYISNCLNISISYVSNLLNKYDLNGVINHFSSNFENDVKKFLDSIDIEYQVNIRNIIYPYELDIYIPQYKLALECNGTYYHSTKFKNTKYHYNKSLMCEENGIRLIHIFEYEWENIKQQAILKNIIKSALNKTETIYARHLKIEERPSSSMKWFFEKNNIQGFRGGKFAICLIDKQTEEIYMAYIMGSAFFGKGKYEWEVIRGATKLGYTVVGGASKIWKYFIKTYKPKNCVYYVDYNYFNGKSLENLPNMKFIKTQPSFKNFWVKENIVKNREPHRNKEIKELYKSGEVLQIYNAGTKVYVWERE